MPRSRFFPLVCPEQKVSKNGPRDHSDEYVSIVGHDSKHQQIAEENPREVQETSDDMDL